MLTLNAIGGVVKRIGIADIGCMSILNATHVSCSLM